MGLVWFICDITAYLARDLLPCMRAIKKYKRESESELKEPHEGY